MNIVFEANPRKKIDRAYVAERMKQTLGAEIVNPEEVQEAEAEKKEEVA
jgi:hypothetical protein